jgi:hypothetical protein
MKVILILLISHLLVCGIIGYVFGQWSAGQIVVVKAQDPPRKSHREDGVGYIPTGTGYTNYEFTLPRAVLIYGLAGLIGILAALVAELYQRFFSVT